jgi:hypothetical protein
MPIQSNRVIARLPRLRASVKPRDHHNASPESRGADGVNRVSIRAAQVRM